MYYENQSTTEYGDTKSEYERELIQRMDGWLNKKAMWDAFS